MLDLKLPTSVLVIDDDEALCRIYVEFLKDFGIFHVEFASSGKSGWQMATTMKYDFVMLDWRMPDLSGLSLLMRFRQDERYRKVPILIVSGYLGESHLKLFRQFLYIDSVSKDEISKTLLPKMSALYEESIWLHDQEQKILKFIEKSESKTDEELIGEFEKIFKRLSKPIPVVVSFANVLQSKNKLEQASKLLERALKDNQNSVVLLTELGRAKILSEDYTNAKRIIRESLKFFPFSTDKLCMLGEVCLNLLELKEAEECFLEVLKVDVENDVAQTGKKTVELMKSLEEDTQRSHYSILNEKAVEFVRMGKIDEGLAYYGMALTFSHDPKIKAKIYLNMGIAYLRKQRSDLALDLFKESLAQDPSLTKAREQLKKLVSEEVSL